MKKQNHIKLTNFSEYKGYLDEFKTSEQTEEDRQNAINDAIYSVVVWSLTSNCKHYRLVNKYSRWAL